MKQNEIKNDLLNFMDWAGIRYQVEGNQAFTTAHDSLKIPLKKGKNYFTWYSRGTWGHLPEFVMSFDGDGFKPAPNKREARKLLKEFRASSESKLSHVIKYDASKKRKFDFATIREEQAPWRSMQYLYFQRKLEPRFIKSLFEHGLITEDAKYHDIMFLWRTNDNKKVGADIQGTFKQEGKKRPYYKITAPGSKQFYGWNFNYGDRRSADKLVITEAPIDALSYFQSFGKGLPNTVFSSISGSASKVDVIDTMIDETILKFGNQVKELHIAVDNDESGHKMIKILQDPEWMAKHPFNIIVDVPKYGKDWNEQLQKGKISKYSVKLKDFKPINYPIVQDKERQRTIMPQIGQPQQKRRTLAR